MVYIAKTQRGAFVYVLLLMILLISRSDYSRGLLYIQITFCLIILGSIFIKYKFEINKDSLTYEILFFKLPLYKKSIYPNQIIRIKFKRMGWYSKGAIIQVRKGFNIRIANFAPGDVFIDLINFANKNGISYSKTKDYCILEK